MKKIRKAVIPVAGLGTRFLPATKAQPKEMLPLVDKPIIQYIVEEAVAAGIEQIIFVTSSTKRAIEDHFDRSFELEYRLRQKDKEKELSDLLKISDMANFVYIRQKTPRGLGHAIYTARQVVGNEPFAVLLGDDIIDAKVPAIKQLMNVYNKYGDIVVGVTKVPKKETGKYGIVDPLPISERVVEIKRIVEKPQPAKAPSNLAVTGRYILTPEIFDILANLKPGAGNEIQLTDAMAKHIKKRAGYASIYQGTYYDCGNKIEFIKAIINLALKRKEFNGALKKYLKNI
ncbi:MAG: UTP--glucose-1-phosphate uridylyltransferase [Candidatus Komeilibacteria bacterium CG11_big_fil_rev_8_21_14_0_20_36_20]|uniref:UTP--glucose-1-phosphate uridylyltransferase n=1 Tax=Candidatus Komeilibacteria bacterium CG11_big_fil_rev_8_21_14_0_20_36_20 TaxID=1974477 RepID=A0A2H0NCH9_9BACT|nr:MAG: UTP--glucose-1-phosphate uridylyltransferase [Candidatus Komeilibacteria bacterium CG11_big_fil_rev_8_21_14_0_20_36_20]PIR81934.1 MAG: UTP--glucose-1-phosphate uridylyltransferase [Candidatus Komeilibacteria bacterium CG10_big_fil_rev_8_21_14_0_10_36_65]PJC55466.1 MAG: UTP--glucose-1-phosphate uridylyltransferase [Candidatus Komeilibacteria bacterium CG_4_9_14_0_2_um_filter_36_13]